MTFPERVARLLDRDVDVAVRAPGRANLIGEHTDYNDGFVLPIAIDLATYVVGRRSPELRLVSDVETESVAVSITDPELPDAGWGRYVAGVVLALRDWNIDLAGVDGRVVSDVPIGAGLSSSAALEIGIAMATSPATMDPIVLAHACRRAENHYVGVQSGIMDQLTSAAARDGHACLIDCRDNSVQYIPVPDGVRFLIIDSGIRRDLASSAYNERVAQCRAAAVGLGVSSLRGVTAGDIESSRDLDSVLRRRARHVVTENERVLATAGAFGLGDLSAVPEIFAASHASYSADFEASIPEIDEMVARAQRADGVLGARLTGGGWGGCLVAVIDSESSPETIADAVGGNRWWVTRPTGGTESLL